MRPKPRPNGIREEGRTMEETRSTRSERNRNRKSASLLVTFLLKLVLFASILVATFVFVLGIVVYRGNRMYPFLMDGDVLVTYKLDRYRVGDCVVYEEPGTGETRISRISAIGPCMISVTDNGNFLVDTYSPSEAVFYPTKPLEDSEIAYPYRLSSDAVFLLDDYRTIGKDSRLFGQVLLADLKGKVVYVFRRRGI